MKKLTFIILFIILLSFPAGAKAYVNDTAGVLRDDVTHSGKCVNIAREYGVKVYVVTDDEEFNDKNELSDTGKNSIGPTVVLFINTNGYNDCVVYNGNRNFKREMFNYKISCSDNNYDWIVTEFLSSAEVVAYEYRPPEKFPTVMMVICAVVSLIVALCFAKAHTAKLKKQLDTITDSTDAIYYLNKNKTYFCHKERDR